ncbi:MAG TPA: aspartate carbamoyltransferase catalytic subunit [Nitrospiraceae bacterium]|jgi:aspartate carbamoyltransferase catalytic subunit|nr:aspartate carbamoyltransferase catalytic subunit [Nitrospiraceae bacterium]
MSFKRKDLTSIASLSADEIQLILETAESFKEVSGREIKKVPALRGKTVVNFFFEPSTRTRTSFELAAKRLSADVINFSPSSSSVVKGETLLDTARNIEAMQADIIVLRHPAAGAAETLARGVKSSVINAGDGWHEHPTQALLDLFTLREKKRDFKGLRVAIVGDIAHSRVARSNIYALTKLGAEVRAVGPPTMIPAYLDRLGVTISYNLDEALRGVDVIMMLRLQLERQGRALFPSIREYANLYGLTAERLRLAEAGALVMHPGPINRGVEIAPEVADSFSSVILDQVANGVAVRMGVLYLLSGASA